MLKNPIIVPPGPPRRRARLALTGAVAVLVAIIVTVSSAPAVSANVLPPPTRPPLTKIPNPPAPPVVLPLSLSAMGDSYTSGEGTGNSIYSTVPGSMPIQEDWRHQTGYAPVHLAWMYLEMARRPLLSSYQINAGTIQRTWGPDRFSFTASSGAKTEHLDTPQMDDSIVRSAPQLDGVDPNSNLAFFGFGGNDAGFVDVLQTALASFGVGKLWPAGSMTSPNWQQTQTVATSLEVMRLTKKMPQVSSNVASGLAKTHARMPNAELIVTLYPLGVKPANNHDIPFLAGTTLDAIYSFALATNAAVVNGVNQFRQANPGITVHVFDPNTAGPGGTSLVAGHEVSEADSYFNPVMARSERLNNLDFFHGLQESFHPNQFGTVAIGQGLATWMAREFPAYFPQGPDFQHVITSPAAYSADPAGEPLLEQWVTNDPDAVCAPTEPLSMCNNLTPSALIIPVDQITPVDPNVYTPTPGSPDASYGGPGGSGEIGPGGFWIPVNTSYWPQMGGQILHDPCGILIIWSYTTAMYVETAGGGLRHGMIIGAPPTQPSHAKNPCTLGN